MLVLDQGQLLALLLALLLPVKNIGKSYRSAGTTAASGYATGFGSATAAS